MNSNKIIFEIVYWILVCCLHLVFKGVQRIWFEHQFVSAIVYFIMLFPVLYGYRVHVWPHFNNTKPQ